MNFIEYSTNNSGGGWWLGDEDWKALEAAGWKVEWYDKPFLGASATHANRYGLALREAIKEWEEVTGERASALGCSCCGPPHSFTEYTEDERYVDSYTPDYPEFGDDY